jgi:hypothetical protein
MEMLGRTIITTTLDPIPPAWRSCPGYFVLNYTEIFAIRRELAAAPGSMAPGPVFKRIAGMIQIADDLDAQRGKRKHGKSKRRKASHHPRQRRHHRRLPVDADPVMGSG